MNEITMDNIDYKRHLYHLIKDGNEGLKEIDNGIEWLTAALAGREAIRETDAEMITGEFILNKPMVGMYSLFLSNETSLEILKSLKIKALKELSKLENALQALEKTEEILLPEIKERSHHKPFSI